MSSYAEGTKNNNYTMLVKKDDKVCPHCTRQCITPDHALDVKGGGDFPYGRIRLKAYFQVLSRRMSFVFSYLCLLT